MQPSTTSSARKSSPSNHLSNLLRHGDESTEDRVSQKNKYQSGLLASVRKTKRDVSELDRQIRELDSDMQARSTPSARISDSSSLLINFTPDGDESTKDHLSQQNEDRSGLLASLYKLKSLAESKAALNIEAPYSDHEASADRLNKRGEEDSSHSHGRKIRENYPESELQAGKTTDHQHSASYEIPETLKNMDSVHGTASHGLNIVDTRSASADQWPVKKEKIGVAIPDDINKVLPPVGEISAHQRMGTVKLIYVVRWSPTKFISEQRYTEEPPTALEMALTLTGTLTNALALPCIQYMRQTWPTTGENILRLIQKLLRAKQNGSERGQLVLNLESHDS